MDQAQLDFAEVHEDKYPPGFFYWISKNQKIWKAFEAKALQMAQRRKHYSARTIIEVMRWHTDLQDTDEVFKLSDHWTPGMARLWMAKHDKQHPNFFLIWNR